MGVSVWERNGCFWRVKICVSVTKCPGVCFVWKYQSVCAALGVVCDKEWERS